MRPETIRSLIERILDLCSKQEIEYQHLAMNFLLQWIVEDNLRSLNSSMLLSVLDELILFESKFPNEYHIKLIHSKILLITENLLKLTEQGWGTNIKQDLEAIQKSYRQKVDDASNSLLGGVEDTQDSGRKSNNHLIAINSII
jgi:hypothetical protein